MIRGEATFFCNARAARQRVWVVRTYDGLPGGGAAGKRNTAAASAAARFFLTRRRTPASDGDHLQRHAIIFQSIPVALNFIGSRLTVTLVKVIGAWSACPAGNNALYALAAVQRIAFF